jgi:hypothetical protein
MLNGCLGCSDCLCYLFQKCLLFYWRSLGTQAKQLNGLWLVCFLHLNSGIKILLAAPIRVFLLNFSDLCLSLVLQRHLFFSCITLVTFIYGTALFSYYHCCRCVISLGRLFSLVKLDSSLKLEFLRLKKLRLEDVLCQLACFRRDDRQIIIANGRCWLLLFEVAVLDLVSVLYHWRSFGLRDAEDSKRDTRSLRLIRWLLSKRFLDEAKLAHLQMPLTSKALRWLELLREWMCEALGLSKESMLLLWLLNFLVEGGSSNLVVGVKRVEILGLRQYQLGLLD